MRRGAPAWPTPALPKLLPSHALQRRHLRRRSRANTCHYTEKHCDDNTSAGEEFGRPRFGKSIDTYSTKINDFEG